MSDSDKLVCFMPVSYTFRLDTLLHIYSLLVQFISCIDMYHCYLNSNWVFARPVTISRLSINRDWLTQFMCCKWPLNGVFFVCGSLTTLSVCVEINQEFTYIHMRYYYDYLHHNNLNCLCCCRDLDRTSEKVFRPSSTALQNFAGRQKANFHFSLSTVP